MESEILIIKVTGHQLEKITDINYPCYEDYEKHLGKAKALRIVKAEMEGMEIKYTKGERINEWRM